MQWGYVTTTAAVDIEVSGLRFNNSTYSISLTISNLNNVRDGYDHPLTVYGVTSSSFKIQSNSNTANLKAFYICVGM